MTTTTFTTQLHFFQTNKTMGGSYFACDDCGEITNDACNNRHCDECGGIICERCMREKETVQVCPTKEHCWCSACTNDEITSSDTRKMFQFLLSSSPWKTKEELRKHMRSIGKLNAPKTHQCSCCDEEEVEEEEVDKCVDDEEEEVECDGEEKVMDETSVEMNSSI
jgi:hypothetical protein